MRSLSAHLVKSEAHGDLPFHPGCPICRETRLVGSLATGSVLSPRGQAILAAGVLAISTAGPAASALAAEPDQEQDGTAPVAQDGTGDTAVNPDFDPGGDSTDLPDTAPPLPETDAPADAGSDDTAPVEQDPTVDPTDPIVDAGDGSDDSAPPPASDTPEPSPPPPTATAQPTVEPSPQPAAPVQPAPAPTVIPAKPTPTPAPATAAPPRGTTHEPKPRSKAAPRMPKHEVRRSGVPESAPHDESPVATPPSAAPTDDPAPEVVTVPAVTVVRTAATPAHPGDRIHTVEAGESLWTIAADVLGRDATPAQVAREVHRLWSLNRARIGTGDPDLVMVGTRLVLR
jgi:hypothetical protein